MSYYVYQPASVSTASGAWSGTSLPVSNGLIRRVYVKAASSGTTFVFTITDDDGLTIESWSGNTGSLKKTDLKIGVSATKLHCAISSASADEAFDVVVETEEARMY